MKCTKTTRFLKAQPKTASVKHKLSRWVRARPTRAEQPHLSQCIHRRLHRIRCKLTALPDS